MSTPEPIAAPIIVSALFGDADFAWLDGLRRVHFPPERNQLSAHLTLFHHLPPDCAAELRRRLAEEAKTAPPAATVGAIMSLGRGTALHIDSPALAAIRSRLADAFAGLLTPQDAGGWRAHVTIQNKVSGTEAKALQERLRAGFQPRPLAIAGLAAWWYRGGPWQPLSRHMFRG